MFVTLVHVHVLPDRVDEFLAATRANHVGSIHEPGNLRFDVLRSADDPTRFVLYECYADETTARAHKEAPHYLAWRDAVASMMAEPRVGVRYDGLLPETPSPSPGSGPTA
jgi:autoinducer 2-degrading protein